MASPLSTSKPTVNLAATGVPGSRIRRAPPPPVKELKVIDPRERDRRTVYLGLAISTLLLLVILTGFASYSGWSPRDYTAHL